MNGNGECPGKGDGKRNADATADLVAAFIRERSAAAQLVSESELALLLEGQRTAADPNETGYDVPVLLNRLVEENEDLRTVAGKDTPWYFSTRSMTEEYAKILGHAQEGPAQLIAETVRRNACVYQRPVPIEIFAKPPFNLTSSQVLDCLATMAGTECYADIATTTTSAAGVYLYSTAHLETEHAVMLAEWFDVGQSENP